MLFAGGTIHAQCGIDFFLTLRGRLLLHSLITSFDRNGAAWSLWVWWLV